MKLSRILVASLASALITLASCSDSKAGDKTLKDSTKGVENTAKTSDLSKLSPEALKTKATEVTAEISKELAAVKDSATAKALVAKYQTVVDELNKAKTTLMSQTVDMSALRKSVDDTVAKFSGNKEVMDVLQPLIDKLRTLTS